MTPKMLVAFILALALGGCAGGPGGYGVNPGVSTLADVRGALGPPAAEFVNADGSRSLAYPSGPLGTQTYMADVAPSGVVRAFRQVLDDSTFQAIRNGMTRDEVLRLIGPPGDTMTFARQKEVSWEYHFVDTWGYRAYFSVNFDPQGRVVSKLTRRIDPERRGLF